MKEGRTETTEHRLWRRVRKLEAALREIDDKANPTRPGVDGDALMAIGVIARAALKESE